MRLRVLQALILMGGLVGSAAQATAAPITYDVNLSGGGETVQGFITTDGVIGDVTGHILSWAFTGSGAFAFSISSATGGSTSGGGGQVLDASLTNLTLLAPTHIPGDNQQLFFHGAGAVAPGYCGQPTFYFGRQGSSVSYAAYASDPCVGTAIFGTVFTSATAVVVASADQTGTPVPEPATLVLFGLGAAGLVASRRRQ